MFDNDKRVILTDIDGVVLNWGTAFNDWMVSRGHQQKGGSASYDVAETYDIPKGQAKMLVRMFNESAQVGFLPPLRDAICYMKKLHEEHGYVFHAITSLSSDPNAQKLRIMNLENLFGKTLFEKYIILGCGDDKDEALEPYRDPGLIWVEDKVENAVLGTEMGLDSILIEHDHNRNSLPSCRYSSSWKNIYQYVRGDDI